MTSSILGARRRSRVVCGSLTPGREERSRPGIGCMPCEISPLTGVGRSLYTPRSTAGRIVLACAPLRAQRADGGPTPRRDPMTRHHVAAVVAAAVAVGLTLPRDARAWRVDLPQMFVVGVAVDPAEDVLAIEFSGSTGTYEVVKR